MKKNFFIPIVILIQLFSSIIYSHDQSVHQHIVREAWKLLLLSYPQLANSEMNQYIGTNETTSTGSEKSWGARKIVSGSWMEDEYDIVYHYGIGNTPNFNQTITPEVADIFFMDDETERKAFVSITHFWDADGGVNNQSFLNDGSGLKYWSFSVTNAMQKMYKYLYGNYNNRYLLSNNNYFGCGDQIGTGWDFQMANLFNLYNAVTKVKAVQYQDIAVDWVLTSCPEFYMEHGDIYEILGRMAHLLGDMSVPAHVHSTSHAGSSGFYSDLYENNVSNFTLYTAESIWNNGGRFVNPYVNYVDPLYYLMYYMNQITDHFADGKVNGDNNYDSNCPGITEFMQNSNWTNMCYSSQVNLTNCESMHNVIFPEVIKVTAGLLYWFVIEANILQVPTAITVTPTTNNVGSIKADTPISGSFIITNAGNVTLDLEITSPMNINLEGQSPAHIVNMMLLPGWGAPINYSGTVGGAVSYGPFTQTITIDDNAHNLHKTHTIVGTLNRPDFCYGETNAMAASPEEQLFDKAFIDYFAINIDSLGKGKDKSLKNRLDFAYDLLKQPKTESVDKICKMIINLYPESEMGISFYAMGLLWEAASSDETPNFKENDFKNFLKELTKRKDKFMINGYAQLILSLLDVGNDITGLEKLFSDYKYDNLKELSLFHQFIHYYKYKNDEVTARKMSDKLDEMFTSSVYGYQAHIMFGDDGYTLEGLKDLMKKKRASLLAKRGESKNDILSEMPTEYKLYNNYPNPFNPNTSIKYSIPQNSFVTLKIYNMMGQLVKTLVSGNKNPGFYTVDWNGANENNSQVVSGIYFYRLESNNYASTEKMILLK